VNQHFTQKVSFSFTHAGFITDRNDPKAGCSADQNLSHFFQLSQNFLKQLHKAKDAMRS